MDKSKNRILELIRFLVCGGICALLDYLTCQLIILCLPDSLNEFLLTTISTAGGFVIGVISNYLISTYWVYQNVANKEETKTPKFIIVFLILSFCALALSILAMLLCQVVCNKAFSLQISNISVMELIKSKGFNFLKEAIFWAYFISFCIKTLAGLVWNYFTRKYILYKEPKE